MLEALMRDGLSLVNVTRRELADGLRALARRQRDARHNSADLEASFARRLSDNTYKIDLKVIYNQFDELRETLPISLNPRPVPFSSRHDLFTVTLQMQEIMDNQKRFVDSCQPVQQDDPNQVANVLDKSFNSLISK